ncbi:hypothetical protein AgCh_031791 [Apium graveolens]
MNEQPKYAYPYPAQGNYYGPPVMAPPQYAATPPPRRESGFLEGWYDALQLCVVAAYLKNVAISPSSSAKDIPLLLPLYPGNAISKTRDHGLTFPSVPDLVDWDNGLGLFHNVLQV